MEPADFVCQFLIEKDGHVQICHFGMCQEDANLIIKHPQVMIASDSSAMAWGFVGGDVLESAGPGGPVVIYAQAAQLGLDNFGMEQEYILIILSGLLLLILFILQLKM